VSPTKVKPALQEYVAMEPTIIPDIETLPLAGAERFGQSPGNTK